MGDMFTLPRPLHHLTVFGGTLARRKPSEVAFLNVASWVLHRVNAVFVRVAASVVVVDVCMCTGGLLNEKS